MGRAPLRPSPGGAWWSRRPIGSRAGLGRQRAAPGRPTPAPRPGVQCCGSPARRALLARPCRGCGSAIAGSRSTAPARPRWRPTGSARSRGTGAGPRSCPRAPARPDLRPARPGAQSPRPPAASSSPARRRGSCRSRTPGRARGSRRACGGSREPACGPLRPCRPR